MALESPFKPKPITGYTPKGLNLTTKNIGYTPGGIAGKTSSEEQERANEIRRRLAGQAPGAAPAKQPKNKILGLPAPVVFILGAGVLVFGVMYFVNRK